MQIHESQENYLETMLILKNRNGSVRSIDVARELGFSKPSISIAVKRFRENGYVTVDQDGMLLLTQKGAEIAERIYERHVILTRMLVHLGVTEEIARKDACRIEHDISDESFQCIKQYFLEKL